ncbi:hypothetical protein ACKWTF_014475 [Chironomus riparius]
MKILKFYLISSLINSIFCNIVPTAYIQDTTALTEAISSICETLFIENSIQFTTYVYGYTTSQTNDVINGFLRRVTPKSQTRLRHLKTINVRHMISIFGSAVIFMQDSAALATFSMSSRFGSNFPLDVKILIFLYDEVQSVPVPQPFQNDSTMLLHYFYYLRNEKDMMTFFTSDAFTYGRCNHPTLVALNVFDKNAQKWQSKLEGHEKFDNFNGCELKLVELWSQFLSFEFNSPEIMECMTGNRKYEECVELLRSTNENIEGLYAELFKISSKRRNFTSKLQIGLRSEDESSKIPIIQLQTVLMNQGSLFPIAYFLESSYMFAVTPTDVYSNYEKLWKPFDDVTWILLLMTFIAAFIVIFVAKFLTNSVRRFIFGREVLTPALNVLQILFGISQIKLPDSSVARFILLLFLFFCLIFRTCYQSMLFDFMTSDMRKPMPRTIEDLVTMDYTIISCRQGHEREVRHIFEHLNGSKIKIYQECNEIGHLYCQHYNSASQRLAFFIEDNQFPVFNAICHGSALKLKNFHSYPSLTPLVTAPNSFMYRTFKDVMERLIPAGIPQHLYEYQELKMFKKYEPENHKNPKVLTVNDLLFGFVLWIGACGMSVVGFMIEIINLKLRLIFGNFVGFFAILKLLRDVRFDAT